MLGNEGPSPALAAFLGSLGQVQEVAKGELASHTVTASYMGLKLVFSMNTLNSATNQKAKKVLANDTIVSLVFQDGPATFHPEAFTSDTVHAFLVVRPEGRGYRVAVVTRDDVPDFGPHIATGSLHPADSLLRRTLLAKLVNLEQACHRSR